MKGFSYHHRKNLLQRNFPHWHFLMKSLYVIQQQKWSENRSEAVCLGAYVFPSKPTGENWWKSTHLPQYSFINCCSPLFQISHFALRFWHAMAANDYHTVFGSTAISLNGIFNSCVSLFWHKHLTEHITSPTLHATCQKDNDDDPGTLLT